MRFVLCARVLFLALALIFCASSAFAGPSSLVATAVSNSQIGLKWSGSTQGWTNYAIERSLVPTTGFVKVGNVSRSTSYTNGSLAAGTTYYYRVRETSRGGVTNIASATTLGGPTNKQPVANAGPDQLTQSGVSVTFNGSGSYDPDGTISTYTWNFGDGGAGSGKVVSHAYSNGGTYTALLTVKDNGGLTGSDSAKVSVVVASTTTVTPTSSTTTTTTTLPGSGGTGGEVTWARGFGSGTPDVAYGVAADGGGNVIVTGNVMGLVDFGGGLRCASFFVAKYTATGVHVWSRCAGDGWTSAATGYAVVTDSTGDVIVTGQFGGTIDFGGGALTGQGDLFVAKYGGTNGAHMWSRAFGDAAGSAAGFGIAVDASDAIVVGGRFSGEMTFGGSHLASSGSTDGFVAKYSPGGAHLWSRRFGDAWNDRAGGVAIDSNGNVVVTGQARGAVDFGGGVRSSAGNAVFVAKYSQAGAHLWSRLYASGEWDDNAGNGVAVDPNGNVVVVGTRLGNAIDFGGGPLSGGGFVLKLSPAGAHVWSIGTSGLSAVAVDRAGSIVTSTWLGIEKYSASGMRLWSRSWLKANLRAVGVDRSGSAVAAGSFVISQTFGGSTLASVGSDDIVVLKVAP